MIYTQQYGVDFAALSLAYFYKELLPSRLLKKAKNNNVVCVSDAFLFQFQIAILLYSEFNIVKCEGSQN